MEATDVAVIGAGPAGLAGGACLRKAGLNFIIVEKNQQVGSSWRQRYERLHLHTIKQLSSPLHHRLGNDSDPIGNNNAKGSHAAARGP